MANNKVSVLIAARNEPYLDRTIADAFNKAQGEVEVIAVLDGYRPDIPDYKQPAQRNPRLRKESLQICLSGYGEFHPDRKT